MARIFSMQTKFLHSAASMELWDSLLQSNENFVKNIIFAKQRSLVQNAQKPPVVILGCADSRVPPELIFDNVVLDSIEFAVSTFGSSLLVVLGHSDCGAVAGALQHLQKNAGAIDKARGHLNAVLIPIETAIIEAGINIQSPKALEEAIQANIKRVANQLIFRSHTISHAIDQKQLVIVGAQYFLSTGKVHQLFTIPHNLK
jgi:carbonic anhydrase